MNLHISAASVKAALRQTWHAQEPLPHPPLERIAALALDKYSTAAWNGKF
jgi:hypothetical protein